MGYQEQRSSGVEPGANAMDKMRAQGTPLMVAIIVGLTLLFMLFLRKGFASSVVK